MEWKNCKQLKGNSYDIPEDWLKLEYFEALNILFRVENALRAFVFIILKDEFLDKWKDLSITSDDEESSTIGAIAKRRLAQDKNYAYLGYDISCPLVHLTSGELIRIITSEKYWKFFKEYFPGSKEIIKNKLDEIGNVRNSVAHFRPIKKGDVELIKQNAIHTLSEIEKELIDFISCDDRVPTNTEEPWYKELVTLQSEYCRLSFFQGKKENWIRINIIFTTPYSTKSKQASWIRIEAFNLKTNGLLQQYKDLIKYTLTVTESNPTIFTKNPDEVEFVKRISFTLSNNSLKKHFKILKAEFEKIILQITTELNLIEQDNLARGQLIEMVSFFLEKDDNTDYFSLEESPFLSIQSQNSPPEYWGNISYASTNFITDTSSFPWMPDQISNDIGLPF